MGVLNCEFIRMPLGGSVEAPSRELLVSGSAAPELAIARAQGPILYAASKLTAQRRYR